MKKQLLTAAAAAAALLCTSPASAQSDSTLVAVPYRQTLSANPLGLLFGYYNAEYERAVSNVASAGLAGSYLSIDDIEVFSVEAKARYYPQARVLSGFSVGGSLGFGQVSDKTDFGDGGDFQDDEESASAFTLGVELDYNWLVGRDRRFFIGTGIGARRLFGGDVSSDAPVVIPTIRLVNIGFAF